MGAKMVQRVYHTTLTPGQQFEHRMAVGQTMYLRSTFHKPIKVSYWVEGDMDIDFHPPTWWDNLKRILLKK